MVRVAQSINGAEEFNLLGDLQCIRNLVLSVYGLKHMRGNAIIEPGHENATYSVKQLAHALLLEKVGVEGAFLQVV